MTRALIDCPITELVPHAGAMCLLDKALEADEASLRAEIEVRPEGLFFDGVAVGAWVGLEYMAQAVAALGGWQARQKGEPPKVGFLLGSRRYECTQAAFLPGQRLQVEVRREHAAANGMGQYDCRIELAGVTIASAILTVYEPQDAKQFLKERPDE